MEGAPPARLVLSELEVMSEVEKMLQQLDQGARRRVIRWASDRFLGTIALDALTAPKVQPGGPIGQAKAHAETLDLARELGVISANDVAARFGITLSGANQRLYTLHGAKLLDKLGPNRYCLPGVIPEGLTNDIESLTSALINLGYKAQTAKQIAKMAVRELGPEATLESMIKHALKRTHEAKNGSAEAQH